MDLQERMKKAISEAVKHGYEETFGKGVQVDISPFTSSQEKADLFHEAMKADFEKNYLGKK